jgi:hypothetical protein
MGVGGQRHGLATFTPGKDPVPIVQEAEFPYIIDNFILLSLLLEYLQSRIQTQSVSYANAC